MRPCVQHQDAVAGQHGREPMRDHERGAVLPSAASSAVCTSVSLSASSDEVASSSSSSGASRRIARAMAMRWRWPPDSVTPRSPTCVSIALRQAVDELGRRAPARRRARSSASLASGRPKRMLSRDRGGEDRGVLRHQRDVRGAASRGSASASAHAVERHACRTADRRSAGSDGRSCSCRRRRDRRSRPSRPARTRNDTPSSTAMSGRVG